jgi:hypothetical protein
MKLLIVVSLSHDDCYSLFLGAVKVNALSLLRFTFFVELYAWSSEGDIGG